MARVIGKSKGIGQAGNRRADASPKTAKIVDLAQRLGRMIPEEELRLIPKDLSHQVDHYVYGTPKK